MLFDTDWIKDEYRRDFINVLAKHANFFKHANRDPEGVIEFPPVISTMFIIFAIRGLDYLQFQRTDAESAFMLWQCIREPRYLKEEGRKKFMDSVGVEGLRRLQSTSKKEFLEAFHLAQRWFRGRA